MCYDEIIKRLNEKVYTDPKHIKIYYTNYKLKVFSNYSVGHLLFLCNKKDYHLFILLKNDGNDNFICICGKIVHKYRLQKHITAKKHSKCNCLILNKYLYYLHETDKMGYYYNLYEDEDKYKLFLHTKVISCLTNKDLLFGNFKKIGITDIL